MPSIKPICLPIICAAFGAAGCASVVDNAPVVYAVVETDAVASTDDAADDPAIWVNYDDPEKSVILGTDKQAGLYVYGLDGATRQFLPAGALNNVDLLRDVKMGDWTGDLAGASNRSDDTVSLFSIENGAVAQLGSFASALPEPYGFCMGAIDATAFAFVAYKTGDLIAYRIDGFTSGPIAARFKFDTQLEGCVFDPAVDTLYVGEEERGLWRIAFTGDAFGVPFLIDEVGGASGVSADVEGLALYNAAGGRRFLIASSQGNNSFAVYERGGDYQFIGRFRIATGPNIDGAEETDGIDATSAALGDAFPNGVLIVQDGYNRPRGETQNFKIVDWRDVSDVLGLNP